MTPGGCLHSIPQSVWDTRRLWSLWDIMQKIEALEFFGLGEVSGAVRERVFYIAGLGDLRNLGTPRKLDDAENRRVKDAVIALCDLCKKIGLSTSIELLEGRE